MRIDLSLNCGLSLKIDSCPAHDQSYPTARIQKGLVMIYEGQELCEEAVGFGVPILKRGLQAIFPSQVELAPFGNGYIRGIRARYTMGLEEKLKRAGTSTLQSPFLYQCKNLLAALIRHLPFLRSSLTRASSLLRAAFAWETTYEPARFSTFIRMTYTIDGRSGKIQVDMDGFDYTSAGVTQGIVMNEQGAHFFQQYRDSDGVALQAQQIGCWDLVNAKEASFICPNYGISFSLAQANGARLYRGRELVGSRLAWAGFGYIFAPGQEHFRYVITIKSRHEQGVADLPLL